MTAPAVFSTIKSPAFFVPVAMARCLLDRRLLVSRDKGVQWRVELGDACITEFGEFFGRDLAGSEVSWMLSQSGISDSYDI
jgi:hypothetical protein